MNHLEQRHLMKICIKYGLDPQEIDNTLNYYENKKHLIAIARELGQTNDAWEIERWAEQLNEYREAHFLTFYLACQNAEPAPSRLRVVNNQFSLREFLEQKRQMG